jgi:hypothetical protein
MDVTVTKVSFRENEANATVHFQAKGNSAPGAGLDLQYTLERKDNQWVVKNTGMMGHGAGGAGGMGGSPDNPHGGAMGTPNPHGPGMMPGGAGTLPPGHPPVGQMPSPQQPTHPTTPPGQSK